MKYEHVTHEIIGAFFQVYNVLGFGFLERVYQNAMKIEMDKRGLIVVPQAKIDVYYNDQKVGEYYADFLVNDCVIVELKACEHLAKEHESQLINYLKATNIDIGLLMNFGQKATLKRLVFETARRVAKSEPRISDDPRKSASSSAESACSLIGDSRHEST